jgi:hypothetical protein
MVIMFVTGMKFLVPDLLPREQEFNQDHFRARITPTLPNENRNKKRKIGKNQLVAHIDNSLCR